MKAAILATLLPLLVSAVLAAETNTPSTASVTSSASPAGVMSNALPASITIDGTTYEDVRWQRVTAATVTIFHKTGVASIPLEKLPPELQQRFGYDPNKAAEWQKAEQQKAAAWQKVEQERVDIERQRVQMERLSKTLLELPLKVGMVGVSDSYSGSNILVLQVLGPNDMRAQVNVRPQNSPTSFSQEVWLKGFPTDGLVDGQRIARNDVLKVTGTKTYTTSKGTVRTIFLLEPLASASAP